MAVTTYEQVPYSSKPYAYATASRLHVVGTLFGVDPPDPTTARVLEIGCAGGGNLVPRALVHPGATFVGIDPARKHVDQARRLIEATGARNVEVLHKGVEDLTPDDGPFDYIVAHGVFSWIPAELRDVLLARCRALLAPRGVAYVSYNTLPGWHMRRMVRDAMLFHIEPFQDPEERIVQARAMLDFLAESSSPAGGGPWGRLLDSERTLLRQQGDDYLFHDHLSPDNEPVYVHQFVAMAEQAGLRYLGEAELHRMMTLALPAEVRRVIEGLGGDLVRTQQYMDFVLNRAFRHSLLVRDDVEPSWEIAWERVRSLYLSSPLLRPKDAPAPLQEGVALTFQRDGRELTSDNPAVKAGWLVFMEHRPAPLPFDAWVDATRQRLVDAGLDVPDDLEETLGRNALYAYAQGLMDLYGHPVATGGHDRERPVAFPVARLQAGSRNRWVTSAFHAGAFVDELDRVILAACDGTRDREALRAACEEAVARGDLVLEDDGEDVPADRARALVAEELEPRLALLGRLGLLMPETA